MKVLRNRMLCVLIIFVLGCARQTTMNQISDTAPVIIYRTKADYSHYVPVRLSEDGSRIMAYPAPGDVMQGNQYRYPVELENGYCWDQQGVGPTTAFLSMTYAEYAALETAPDPKTLMKKVLDKDPFLEMYHGGKVSEYHQVQPALNKLIRQGRLREFPSLLQRGGE